MNLIEVVLGQLEGYVVTDWGNGASIATVQVDVGGGIANSVNSPYATHIIDDFVAKTNTSVVDMSPVPLPLPRANYRARPPSRRFLTPIRPRFIKNWRPK